MFPHFMTSRPPLSPRFSIEDDDDDEIPDFLKQSPCSPQSFALPRPSTLNQQSNTTTVSRNRKSSLDLVLKTSLHPQSKQTPVVQGEKETCISHQLHQSI